MSIVRNPGRLRVWILGSTIRLTGHTQISTTANVYGHVLPDIQRAATTRLDDVLGPQGAKTDESKGESPEAGAQDEEGDDEAGEGAEGADGDG